MPHLYQNLSYNDNCKYTDRKRAKNAFSYIKYFFLLFIITATASVSIILSNPNTASAVPATALETYETKGYDEQIRTLREEYAAAIVKYAGVVDGTVRPENLAEADNAPEVIEIKKRLDAAEADPAVTLRIDQWSAQMKATVAADIAQNKDPDVVAAKAVLTRAIEARAATPGDPQLDVAVETAELALENAIIGIDVKAAAAAAKAKAAEDATKSVSKCPPGGIGWILCPVLNTMGFMADTMLSLFKGFLQVDAPSILNVGGDTYKVWQQILSVANVIFVIVFLVVVFSQISNVGITNYGIKKILPKLIIAVILVNLSFYICQIAVDLSNLVGNSLQNLIDSFAKTPSPLAADDFWSNLLTGTAAGATGVLVVTAGLAIAWANIAAIIPALIAALIALLLILFILVSRQALIVLLTIVAPLAFVAMVLPNTEKLFKTWQKTFMSMLLLYPIVTGVFGVAKFASGLLFNLHETDMLWQIMAGAVSIVPLFVVPLLLKSSMNGIGKLGSTLNGLGDKWGKGAGAKYTNSDLAKNYAAKKAERQAQINAGTYSGRGGNWNPANLRSRLHGGANKNRAYNWATAGLGGKTDLDAMAKGRKEVSESTALFDGDDKLAQVYAETGGGENINGTIDPATGLNANGLNKAQLARLQLMRNTGQHKKASSFLAASKLMAEKGAGNMADYTNAINQARARGASETQLLESSEDISAAYITGGRGDMAGLIDAHMEANGGFAPPTIGAIDPSRTQAGQANIMNLQNKNWGKVTSPSSIKLDGVNDASYSRYLANPENLKKATRSADSMRSDVAPIAKAKMVAAANSAGLRDGQGNVVTFSNIEDLRKHFNITTTSI